MPTISAPYEAMFVVPSSIEEERINAILDRAQKVVSDAGGTVVEAKIWDKRRLAYEIGNSREGYYLYVSFNSAPDVPVELNRVLGLTEEVVRARIFRQDEDAPPIPSPRQEAPPVTEKAVETEPTPEPEPQPKPEPQPEPEAEAEAAPEKTEE